MLLVSNSEEANVVDVVGAFPGADSGVFMPNGAGAAVLWNHLDGDWIASVTSSDPTIARIDAEESNDGSTAFWQGGTMRGFLWKNGKRVRMILPMTGSV